MIKKLDRLIIRAFIGPFIATFFITLLVLIMQFFWLYIDDFVGKGLDTKLIFEFILYQSAVLVPLALPLAVLLSSLMTFGNLGESFELVAIKSAGISLLRFMRPLFVVTIFISFIAFLFSNYVIPVANLKSRTMLGDIVYAKPAFDLKEGVFYDKISGFAIKIGEKKADSLIRDIIIYEQNNTLQDNFIIAKSGVMRVTPNKRFLEFVLNDGWRYQERGNPYDRLNGEYIRVGFKEYTKRFDLSSLGLKKFTNDSVNRNNERMLSMRQLEKAIDSLKKENKAFAIQARNDNFRGSRFTGYLDSGWKAVPLPTGVTKMEQLLPDSAVTSVTTAVRNAATGLRINAETMDVAIKAKEKNLRKHKIEWHRKIVLSIACLVLFLIGAPLGSIIRKGGLGTPLIFAIAFFMVFYFASTTGEKSASVNTLTPFTGMWLATFILVPVGVFLTYKAMHDSQLFNKEKYSALFRLFTRKKKSPAR